MAQLDNNNVLLCAASVDRFASAGGAGCSVLHWLSVADVPDQAQLEASSLQVMLLSAVEAG
jgi:hypothetical protein